MVQYGIRMKPNSFTTKASLKFPKISNLTVEIIIWTTTKSFHMVVEGFVILIEMNILIRLFWIYTMEISQIIISRV